MKKVTFLALHLGYGGIEKCISNVANLLCDDYEVEILCTYKLYDTPKYPYDSKIKITYLTDVKPNRKELIHDFKHFKIFSLIKECFKAIKVLYLKKKTMINALKNTKSDVFISTRIYFNKLLGKYGFGTKIGWEHNHHHNDQKYIKLFTNSCKNLDKVILVSKELTDYYSYLFNSKCLKCKCEYIPNFININTDQVSNLNNNNLISVGRLSKEKGFLDLIDVFKLIDMEDGNYQLNIIGDGLELNNINKKIVDLNLSRKIKLLGYQDQSTINNMYLNSCLYLMTSYTESFGLVLIEAMAYGLPCIAYSSAEGAKDIIVNGYNGYLIDNRNEHDMAKMVLNILKDRKKLNELSKNAKITSQKYSSGSNKKYWLEIIG